MLQMWFDTRHLVELGKMLNLPLDRADNNYLVHCALGELFGDSAPKPFAVQDSHRQLSEYDNAGGRQIRILGYAELDSDALENDARMYASPQVSEICDWDRFASKRMPENFESGTELGFEIRGCPVIRKSSAGEGQNQAGESRSWEAGEELDAFLSHAWENPDDDFSRESVYCNWFRRQLDNRGGAQVDRIGMERFSIERMTRRTHGSDRSVNVIKRPDVTLSGVLEVTDGEAFGELIESGIGRHKSFGYGMLKLRRPH
jgi:CRISPR system Cascade subunit CasE